MGSQFTSRALLTQTPFITTESGKNSEQHADMCSSRGLPVTRVLIPPGCPERPPAPRWEGGHVFPVLTLSCSWGSDRWRGSHLWETTVSSSPFCGPAPSPLWPSLCPPPGQGRCLPPAHSGDQPGALPGAPVAFSSAADLTRQESASPQPVTVRPGAVSRRWRKSHRSYGFPGRICHTRLVPCDSQPNRRALRGQDGLWEPLGKAGCGQQGSGRVCAGQRLEEPRSPLWGPPMPACGEMQCVWGSPCRCGST